VRVGIRADDPELLRHLARRLPPGFRPTRSRAVDRLYSAIGGGGARVGVRRFHLLYADGVRLARSLDPAAAPDALQGDVRRFLAEHARGRVFVHAGAVAWNGRAVLVPGRSFSGKSRLVAALVKAGATYYSDEYAVLDRHGRVHPFPTPLSLRPSADGTVPPRPAALRPGRRPLPVGLVLVTEYRPSARPRLRPLSRGQGVLALLAHTVPARSRPAESLGALRRALAGAAVMAGVRGEAEELAPDLLRRVAA
jgi:hypothetical protein